MSGKANRTALEIADEKTIGNKRALRAIIIGVDKVADTDAESKEILNDPFKDLYGEGVGQAITPPYNLRLLSMLYENSTELGQCLDAMEVNIEGFGYHLKQLLKGHDIPEATIKEIENEKLFLTNFFDNIAVNAESFVKLRRKTRRDIESNGNGFWEIIPDTNEPPKELMAEKPAALNHIPSHTVRITAADEEPTEVKQIQPMKTTDGSLEMKEVKIWRRFRRYIHSRGSKKVYYKEYGDPRVIDCRNGKVVKESLEKKYHANPMIHFYIYSPRSPYGIPRWIGQLFSVFGSRSAEEINFKTLKSNNIPSMLVLVSNGMLTEGSISRIEEFVETQIAGDGNYSKFLLLEAEAPEEEGLGSTGTMKIETTPLTNVQHTDQLFQLYDENNADKIRRAFRLPPIFVGKAQDYTRATAEQSRRLADEQVFAPERLEIDHVINYRLLPLLEIKYHRFQSNSPNTTDNKELAQILSFSEKTGGLTPNIARAIMSDIFGIDLGEVDPSKFDGDIPFTITIAEKVKKQDPRLNQEAIVSKITKTLLGINEAEAEGGVLDVDQINDLLDLRRMVTDAINDKYADEFEDLDKEAAL